MPRASTPSASSDERAWSVPESLRSELARPYGPVYTGLEAERAYAKLDVFATCGDVVTAEALRLGRTPWIAIVDGRTRRERSPGPVNLEALTRRGHRRVWNPAGLLTEGLRTAVRELVASGGGLIEVDGEEDLGAFALVESLPLGATVIYGIPGAGASFVRVDAETKAGVKQLLARMPVRMVGRGD